MLVLSFSGVHSIPIPFVWSDLHSVFQQERQELFKLFRNIYGVENAQIHFALESCYLLLTDLDSLVQEQRIHGEKLGIYCMLLCRIVGPKLLP